MWIVFAAATTSIDAGEWKIHRQSASLMGTKWHIALYSRDTETANVAFLRAWDVLKEIDSDLSNYSADSELNRLCRGAPHATPVNVGDHLWNVLIAADILSRETGGAFDVTIGPVSKLWRHARKRKALPAKQRLNKAHSAVGFRFIELHRPTNSVRLTQADMQIDLGGIAKGYGVDKAIEAIQKCGIRSVLVNGGGDLAVANPPPDQSGWQVDVSQLDPTKTPLKTRLANAAIATSGDAWQFVEINGRRYSHIIDPRTGIGMTRRMSVSVIAPTCMQADSLASALCVLKPSDGMALVRREKRVESMQILAGDDGELVIYRSEGFPTK